MRIGNRVHFLHRSANTSASSITGKKLFNDDSHINQTKQDNLPLSAGSLEEVKVASVFICTENGLEKENYGVSIKEDGSPLLSVQLQELSNNLKKLVTHKNELVQ